jgi:hypothetical protein
MENLMNTQGTDEHSLTVVLPDRLLKRNLAQQSKWLNDDTGERPWATHETQQVAWMMGRQVEALARGK